VEYGCRSGDFSAIKGVTNETCKDVDEEEVVYTASTLSVHFNIVPSTDDECEVAPNGPSLDLPLPSLPSLLIFSLRFLLLPPPYLLHCPSSILLAPSPPHSFAFLLGLTEPQIIGIGVAGGALVVILITVGVIFGVKSIRSRVLPHRDRQSFKASKEAVY